MKNKLRIELNFEKTYNTSYFGVYLPSLSMGFNKDRRVFDIDFIFFCWAIQLYIWKSRI